VRLNFPAPRVGWSPTGAGDAFAAGFLSAELAGTPRVDCLRAGIDAGTKAVKTIGGQPS
jgi:sugar/nucleoside kinase (ribokinase family)